MKIKIRLLLSALFILILSVQFHCSGVSDAIENAQRLQFRLGKVDNLNLAGVRLNNITSLRDVTVFDGANLLAAFASGKMPTTFTVNLIAKNPNSAGGSAESSAILKALDWRLLIDNKDIISGAINTPITIPGVGKETVIPIPITVDLLKFFGDGGYESLLNLALAIGGKTGNSSRLTLKIKPTVDTFLGAITYPGEISVIDKEFR
ncbi:MAG: hypothetical protein ABI462_03965 [Ignavibacteria bacterium]